MSPLRAFALNEEERQRAARVNEIAAGGPSAVDELVRQLDDPSWAVRRAVVAAVAAQGEVAIAPLVDLINRRRDNEARLAAAVDALVASRGDAEKAALELLESANRAIVCDGVQILGRRRSVAAVPKLTRLASDADDNVALAAIEALGRIDSDAAITPLIAAVESGSFFRAFPAIDVLGRSNNPRVVRPLLAALQAPYYAVEAARALGRIGDPLAIPALTALLAKPGDAMVRAAALALVEIQDRQKELFGSVGDGGEALGGFDATATTRRLVHALKHADPNEQAAIVRVLGWVGGDVAIVALIDMLAGEPAAARTAATALVHLGVGAESQLFEGLRTGDSEQRLTILPLLRHGKAAVGPISDCLGDSSATVRALACEALARIGDTSVVPRLFGILTDGDARVSQSALAAIQSLGSNETEALALEAASASDARLRRAGLRIVAYFGYRSGLGALLDAMRDQDERIRDTAILGLPLIDDPRAIDALVSAAGHASSRTRAAAMRAIGEGPKHPATLRALHAALHDADPWVRYFACQAVGRVGDESAADAIVRLLGDEAGQVRVAAVEALARLRGVRALDALHRAVSGEDADVRRAALLGLGHVRDPSSLPALRAALTAGDPATRLVAVSALAEYELPEVAHDLGGALGDADDNVRSAAVALLTTRPGPAATRALISRLSDPAMRTAVVAALAQPAAGRIEVLAEALEAATETAPYLVSALMRSHRAEAAVALENAFGSSEVAVRRAVAPALARLGTRSARARLERAASSDPDDVVRQLSVAALA